MGPSQSKEQLRPLGILGWLRSSYMHALGPQPPLEVALSLLIGIGG